MFDYNKALQLGLTPQEIAIGLAERYGLDYDKATELGLTDDEIISELMARNGLSKEAPEEVEQPEVEQPEVEQPEEKNFLLNFNMAPGAYQESWDAPGQAQTTFEVEKGPDGNLERGVKTTAMGLGVGEDIVGDDMDAAAKGLSQMVEYQEKNKGSQREQEFGAAWDSKEGFARFGAIHDKVKERWEQAPDLKSKVAGAYEDAKEFGGLVARQLPNSALPVALGTAGAALGFVAPVPGATMGGMFAGYAAGNTAVEMSGIAMEMLNEAGIDIKDQAAVSKFLYDNRARIIDAAAIKGTIIAGVDTATTMVGGKILSAPARKAAERVLSQMGVKLTDKAAVKAATESAEFMARVQADPVFKAATSGVRNIGRNATVAAMEPVSETAGEYLGGGAALGKWDVDSLAQATAEGVTAIGQSAAGFAGAKVYQAATSPITPTKMAAGRAQLFNRLEAELDAGTLTEDEVRQWHTDGVLDGYQVTTEDLDRVIKGTNQKTVDEVLAKQAEMDQRRADILRGVQEEVEAGNESPESIIQRLENGEFAPDGISDDDIYNIIGEEYRPVDLTPEGKAKLEEEAKRTEQEEEFDEAFDEYEPELPTGAMPLQEDLARNRREVEDAAFASYYPDMPTSREEYEAQRAFIMRNPEDVYSTYSPELARAIVVGKLPPPPWMHSKSTPIAQAEADDMYVEWLDQRLKALQYNRERNNTPDAQPAKPLTAAERKTLAQNAEWDELVRKYQEQGTGWIHTEPAEDKSQPFTMRPSEEVYSSYSPEVARQAGRRQLPAPERKTNRIAEEAANQPKGLPAPVDKEKFEITGRPVEEIDAEVKAIRKTPKKDRTPEQTKALDTLYRERKAAIARTATAQSAAAARPAENAEGRTTVDQITAEITDLQAKASVAEDTANQLEATGQVNKAAIERSKAATYRSRVSTLMEQRKALKSNNTPDASVASAPTGVTPTTAQVPSVASTAPAAGGAMAVESVPEAPTTPKRGKKAAKKVQEADPPSVETVTAPVAEIEASTPEVSAEMSPEISTETPEIAAEVAPAAPEMSPEMSTSEKQEKRTTGQRMVAFSMATTPEEYDAVVSDMTAEEVDAFEDSLGWADGETTFKEIRDALNRRRRTIGAARKQEPGAQRLTAFKAELAKVVSKGRANGIVALLKARAASAGTSVEQYLESRQLELVANSQAGTAAQRQANKGAFDVGTWVQEQRAIIHAFESADVSTIAHELAHLFRRDLAMAKDNAMLQLAEEWAGVKDGVWTEAQEEKFARAFERYLAEGKAPNAGLKKLFDAFKKWMTEVYRAIKGSDIDVKLTPQIRVVFDALLTEGYVQDKGTQDATQDGDGDGMLNQTMSARTPTAKKATEDPLNEVLVLDHKITMADEVTLAKNMAVVAQYPNMRKLTGRGAKSPKRQAEAFIDHIVDNLLFLHDLVPSEFRRRAKLWYDGGRKIVETWADRYGISEMQASSVVAVLSPQNDWFANVTHAERVMDIVFSMRDFRWDDAMTKTAKQIEAAMSETAKATEAKVGHFRNAKGKTLGELLDNPAVAARWIRVFDQTHNSRYHAVLTPEGGVAGNKKRADGHDATAQWKSFSAIAKAVSVLTDGRAENIFYQLGGEHKVRNFYNNLFDPKSGLPFVTIDTHAVAAGLLRPLAGESMEVKHNFGTGKGSSSSTITGQSGTYPLFAEAYRRAAEARGISPREMQSITWEIARGLFNNKKSKSLNEASDEIWTSYKKGELTQQEAQAKILELVGGVKDPDWIDVPFNDTFGPTYEGKSRQAFVDRKNAGAAPNDHRIFFEVAPSPDNKELSARWKALSEEEQQRVSKDIMDLVLPRIMTEFGVSGTVEFQLGGYEGEPNPSFALSLSRPEDSVAVAKMLGHVLSQKGMMVVAGEHLVGTSPVGAVIVELPDGYGATEVNALYDRLWTLEKDGERLVGGHSTNDGQMIILNFTGVDTDQLAMLIYDHLGGEFEVGTDTVFSTYFEKEEYGYADQSEHKDKAKPSVQTRGDLLRDEASRRLEAALAEREQSAGLLFQSGPGGQGLVGEGDLRGGRAPNGVPVREDGRVGLVHFSRQAGLQELDPAKHGTGLSGAESRRKQNDPGNWVDRTYFAIEGGGYRKEVGLGPHRYNASLNPEQLYNAVEDPDGFMAKAREIRQADPFVDTTSVFERLIKDAGYQGYFSNRMGLVAAVYTKTKPESYQNQPEQGLLFQERPIADLREDLFEGESHEALVEIGTRVYNRGLHKVGEFTNGMEEELGALYEQYKGAKINKLFTEVRKKVAAEKKSARIDSLLEAAQKEMPLRNKRRFRELIQAVADTRLDIHQKEKIFIKYAKEKLPEKFRGGEVLQFITQISGKGTPAGRQKVLLEGLKLIDRTYDKVEAEQAVKKIMRLVRSVKPKVVDKKLKGDGFTPDTFEVMAAIRKVVTMGRDAVTKKMEAILNLADAEGRDLSTDLNPNGATSLEKLSELQQYIILQRFGALRHKSGAEALKTLDWLEGFLKAKKDEYLANEKHFRYKVKTMTNLFVAEATGGKGVKSWAGQQQDASDRQKSIWKKLKDMASDFDTGHLSFEMILDKLTQEAGGLLNARSVRYFSNMLHNATRRYDAGVIKYQGVLADKVQEIYGMKGSKLERILNDNGIIRTQTGVIVKPAKKGQDGKYLKDQDGNFIFEEKGEQLPLSQNQAYKLWQALQDPEVLNSQRVHGLNEETIVQLENFIDKKVMDWAKWQLQEFYPSYYKTINVTYKQIFHVDLPLNSYYSPISREHDGADKNELSLVGRSHLSSVINNSLLSRSKSNNRLILSDGDSVIQQHVIMMEHFKAWAVPMREIRGVFHNKEVMEAIRQTGTKFTLDVLHKMIDDLARGGVDRATALGAMDRARNRVTTSMIGLSPKIVAIQMTAIPAYMMEIPMGAFLKGFGKGMAMLATNPKKFVSVIKASKMMQNRYKVGWERDLILLNRRRSAAILSGKSSLSDLFMATVKFGDMAAVFTGGFAVYEYQYDQAIKMGMTPEAAHDYALDRFEIATERTQQAGNVKDLAHFQTAGGSFGKLFTMFMTQPNAIYRGTMVGWRAAITDLKKGRMPRPAAIRRIAVGHFVLPVIFQLVSNGFDWDTEDQLATLALGPFAGMIFVRDIVEGIAAVTQYGYAAMRPQMSPIFSGFESLLRAIYHSIVKEDPTTEDYITTMHALGSLAGNLTGTPVDPVVRSAKGAYRALEGETDHPLLEMLGWGPGSFPEDDGW